MTDAYRLKQLQRITTLVLDRDLSRLSAALAAKARTEALLSSLDHTATPADLNPTIARQMVDRYGLWTANRRIQLNQQLARDTVDWMEAKSDAQRAFGRTEVMAKILRRL